MEQVQLKYSTKNIPLHSNKEYRIVLIKKTRKFLRNLKWKAHCFLNPMNHVRKKEKFGFNSPNMPPSVKEFKKFEEDFITEFRYMNYFDKKKSVNEHIVRL